MSADVGVPPAGDDPANHIDAGVVEEIFGLLTALGPRSFFLFAGAGSGKTRTLVEVLERLTGMKPEHQAGSRSAKRLREAARTIGVITYTNNAVAVINSRLGINPLVTVSTIHTFAWQLIQGFDNDIRAGLQAIVQARIDAEEATNALRTRPPTRTSLAKLEKWNAELEELTVVAKFTYSPDKLTHGLGALNHAQVVQVAAALLRGRTTLARILNDRHPILLIDESQDTMRGMLEALIEIEQTPGSSLRLGLIGDHRQRIYMDGHRDLPSIIPDGWARPMLRMNHRSQARIVKLINRIWAAELDGRTQLPAGGAQESRKEHDAGLVRIFVGSTSEPDKPGREQRCAEQMADITGAEAWRDHGAGYKALMLEHKLAASRGGFKELAEALEMVDRDRVYERERESDGRRGASKGIAELKVFREALAELLSTVAADGTVDEYRVMNLATRWSPMMTPGVLASLDAAAQRSHLVQVRAAVSQLLACWRDGADPTLGSLARTLRATGLFPLHERLATWAQLDADGEADALDQTTDRRLFGLNRAMQQPWSELLAYIEYLKEETTHTTHQAVKGSEYDHVLVVLDDEDAAGFQFSYDKLFGAVDLSDRDRTNAEGGKETTIDRTLRLLYVTCSRPRESLAVVYWSRDPTRAVARIQSGDWFEANEIVLLPPVD